MLEPILVGAAHVRTRAREIAADGTQAGAFAAYLYLKCLFYVALAFDVLPKPELESEGWEIPRVKFVAPEGYDRVREQFEFWYTVGNEQYITARSRLGTRAVGLIFGQMEVVRVIIQEMVRRSFEDDHLVAPKSELSAYAAQSCSMIESITSWLRRT